MITAFVFALAVSASASEVSAPAAAPAPAAVSTAPISTTPTTQLVAVDARFELLGVVARLAGAETAGAAADAYRQRIDKRFAPFRDHAAVRLYKQLAAEPTGAETLSTFPLYFSDPPALALKDADADIHYLAGDGRRELVQRLLVELRAFARASDFAGFFRENAAYYRELEAETRKELAGVQTVPEIERLLGISLASRTHSIISPLARATHDFIVPYPLPPGAAGAKSFDVYSIPAESLSHSHAHVWPEPLYVFIDPSFYYFEKYAIPDPPSFYGPELAKCRAVSPECHKHFVATALIERLTAGRSNAGVAVSSGPAAPLSLEQSYVKALVERLDEYEKNRARYPTLWSFYPRLFSVFHELAHAGKPAKLSVPAADIRSAADFFDPAVVKRLTR